MDIVKEFENNHAREKIREVPPTANNHPEKHDALDPIINHIDDDSEVNESSNTRCFEPTHTKNKLAGVSPIKGFAKDPLVCESTRPAKEGSRE
jgi:hypothetical protein